MKRILTIMMFTLSLGLFAMPSYSENLIESEPGFGTMALDFLVARPALFGWTVTGAALYVVSLPFSYAAGNHEQAANVLVREPAYSTFSRCLGCKASDRLKNIEHIESIQEEHSNF